MAGRPSKKAKEAQAQAKAAYDEFEGETDNFGGDIPSSAGGASSEAEIEYAKRDWRDVEKYKEMLSLKRQIDEGYDEFLDGPRRR
jgi:hypothetical protein